MYSVIVLTSYLLLVTACAIAIYFCARCSKKIEVTEVELREIPKTDPSIKFIHSVLLDNNAEDQLVKYLDYHSTLNCNINSAQVIEKHKDLLRRAITIESKYDFLDAVGSLVKEHKNTYPYNKPRTQSSGEKECERVINKYLSRFDVKQNYRPKWLVNPVTGRSLELDFYIEQIDLAIEIDGPQHDKYVPAFHPNGEVDLLYQKYRDRCKLMQCKKRHVHLLTIKTSENIENTIVDFLTKRDYI